MIHPLSMKSIDNDKGCIPYLGCKEGARDGTAIFAFSFSSELADLPFPVSSHFVCRFIRSNRCGSYPWQNCSTPAILRETWKETATLKNGPLRVVIYPKIQRSNRCGSYPWQNCSTPAILRETWKETATRWLPWKTAHLELSFIPNIQRSNRCGSYPFKVFENRSKTTTPPIPLIIRFIW